SLLKGSRSVSHPGLSGNLTPIVILRPQAEESLRSARREERFFTPLRFVQNDTVATLVAKLHHYLLKAPLAQCCRTRYTVPVAFAFEALLPSWMTYIDGEVPILFVAPHGGRRPADAPILDSIKVNDLHTADLTTELATRTRGYALINHALDRNALDLNRTSQVRTHAPWFLAALEELLSTLVEKHGAARVFFIHGWNVVQSVCDI